MKGEKACLSPQESETARVVALDQAMNGAQEFANIVGKRQHLIHWGGNSYSSTSDWLIARPPHPRNIIAVIYPNGPGLLTTNLRGRDAPGHDHAALLLHYGE